VEKPFWGHGTGSSEAYFHSILDHPHNDYLRVYHDLGVIGLILFLWVWPGRACRYFKQWRAVYDKPQLAQPQMAATLAALSVVFAFITDNPLVYDFVQVPVFLLFAIADNSMSRYSTLHS
jgi:O-antigen ligase